MHIRHRCRNGPRLIKRFFAFPAEVPTGYLLRCFHEPLPGARIWNVSTDKWTPHLSQTSVLCSFSFRLYGFIRGHAGCKLGHHCKKDSGQWKPVWNCIAFIFMEWEETAGAGRWVSWYHSRYIFKEMFVGSFFIDEIKLVWFIWSYFYFRLDQIRHIISFKTQKTSWHYLHVVYSIVNGCKGFTYNVWLWYGKYKYICVLKVLLLSTFSSGNMWGLSWNWSNRLLPESLIRQTKLL